MSKYTTTIRLPKEPIDEPLFELPHNLSQRSLKGKIKTLNTTIFNAYDNQPLKKDSYCNNLFDENGNETEIILQQPYGTYMWNYKYDDSSHLIEQNAFNPDGKQKYRLIRKYNDKGKLIEISEDNYRIKYLKYDVQNNLIEVKLIESNRLVSQETREYDENNNLIDQKTFKGDLSLDTHYIFKYDHENNKTEEVEIKPNGRQLSELINYDYIKNHIEMSYYKTDGSLHYKMFYGYDGKGNLIDKSQISDHGTYISKQTCKYDDGGNIVEYNDHEYDGKIRDTRIYKYDEAMNVIEERVYQGNELCYVETTDYYDFDSQGNWLKKKFLRLDELEDITLIRFQAETTREIEYYNEA